MIGKTALIAAPALVLPFMIRSLVGGGIATATEVSAIGALGAFIAGSNTVSNMMFSQFQFEVAQTLGVSTAAMLALQAVGAAAGNMIAIHNVVAASATVGLLGREGATLRKTALPTLYYLLVTGLIGLALMYSFHISDALLQLK